MKKNAVVAVSALAQETRLDIFRYLVRIGSQGLAAGQIGSVSICRARTRSLSLIPVTTGSARAITRIFSELKGRLDGLVRQRSRLRQPHTGARPQSHPQPLR